MNRLRQVQSQLEDRGRRPGGRVKAYRYAVSTATKTRKRPEIRSLSTKERKALVAAILKLKASGGYKRFITLHAGNMAGAHMGPAFLPWHRQFILEFELALRKIDKSVILPYWDWRLDAASPKKSPLWGTDLFGGNGTGKNHYVTTGPFKWDAKTGKGWQVYGRTGTLRKAGIQRTFGVDPADGTVYKMPTGKEIDDTLKLSTYDAKPWDTSSAGFRNALEGWPSGPKMHNVVHMWVGGSMSMVPTAPNDPVFFVHHANVDRLWSM